MSRFQTVDGNMAILSLNHGDTLRYNHWRLGASIKVIGGRIGLDDAVVLSICATALKICRMGNVFLDM